MAIERRRTRDGSMRYVARVWDPVLRRKVSRSFKRLSDAEKAEADMKVRMFTGHRLDRPQDVLFSELAEEVLNNCTASSTTIKEYRRINRLLIELVGKKSMRQLTVRDIEKVVAELSRRYAPNTVNKAVIRLRHICKRAIAYGYVTVSPAEHISNKPKIGNVRKMEILEEEEIKALIERADEHWKPLFILWLATGMRRAEIFGLDPSCIDVANNRIHVRQQLKDGRIVPYTKSRRPRTIDVAPEIIEIVVRHMSAAPHAEGTELVVFPSITGKPVHVSDWYRDVYKPLVASIGRPGIGTHALRHSFASHALSHGMNIKALQQALGHADAALTLNRYSHLIPSDGRSAARQMADFLLHEESVTTYGHSLMEEASHLGAA